MAPYKPNYVACTLVSEPRLYKNNLLYKDGNERIQHTQKKGCKKAGGFDAGQIKQND